MLIFKILKVSRRGKTVLSRSNNCVFYFPVGLPLVRVTSPSLLLGNLPLSHFMFLQEKKNKIKKGKDLAKPERSSPSPPSHPLLFQLSDLPHRASVSLTTTSVGKLARPPTRRTAPLDERATHRRRKGGGSVSFSQNFSLIVLPPHSTKMSEASYVGTRGRS